MNKTELIAVAAEQAGLSKKDTEKALAAMLDTITAALASGEKVSLVGFGTFETKSRNARMGRNPKTKEEIRIPASKAPVFKAGKALREARASYDVKVGDKIEIRFGEKTLAVEVLQVAEAVRKDDAVAMYREL